MKKKKGFLGLISVVEPSTRGLLVDSYTREELLLQELCPQGLAASPKCGWQTMAGTYPVAHMEGPLL